MRFEWLFPRARTGKCEFSVAAAAVFVINVNIQTIENGANPDKDTKKFGDIPQMGDASSAMPAVEDK